MREWIRTELASLIENYELHNHARVRLRVLEDIFPFRYHDLSSIGALGLILPPPAGWPATPLNRARVVLDETLHPSQQPWLDRLVYAHEVGHGVCRHLGTEALMTIDLHGRAEREAWEVAAHLLVPEHVLREERERDRIAAVCHVPGWLVDLRCGRPGGPRGRARDAPVPNTDWGRAGEALFCSWLWGFWGAHSLPRPRDFLLLQHIEGGSGD